MRAYLLTAFVAFCVGTAVDLPAQGTLRRAPPGQIKALAPGKLLVASRDLLDPNFVETVVLLIDYDKDGAAGLVVNARTDVPLAKLFSNLELGANAKSQAFSGGPVAPGSALVLVRSRLSMAGGRTVVPEIHLISTRELLDRTLTDDTEPERFRVYLGRSGWGPGQLERETERGAWHVFDADAGLIFDPDPTTVWRRLIRQTELQLASARH